MGPFQSTLHGSSLVCAGNYSELQLGGVGGVQCLFNPLVPRVKPLQTRVRQRR